MEIIIEEISRGHKLINRQKFSNQEINLGRGYDNDIILSDPHICPQHLKLTQVDGQWLISDLNTINGSYLNHKHQLSSGHVIESGDVISIGKSQFRFILPNHPVAESIKFSPFEDLINFCRKPQVIIFALLSFTLLNGFMFYLNKPQEFTVSQILVPAIGLTLLFSVWPLLCALIAHLSKHEARVLTQLGISFIIFNLFWVNDFIEVLLSFNLSSKWSIGWLSMLTTGAIVFALFWLNLYVAFNQEARRRTLQALSMTAILVGGSYVVNLSQQPEFQPHPQYNGTLMSPIFSLASPSSVDKFITESDRLFKANDKQVRESKES